MKITVQWKVITNTTYNDDGSFKDQWNTREMRVLESDHPRFSEGTRFDFGFLTTASREGYIIEILP